MRGEADVGGRDRRPVTVPWLPVVSLNDSIDIRVAACIVEKLQRKIAEHENWGFIVRFANFQFPPPDRQKKKLNVGMAVGTFLVWR